ncbi:MAG: hypothetical protein R3F61_23180 [Myxococcota bacterium]
MTYQHGPVLSEHHARIHALYAVAGDQARDRHGVAEVTPGDAVGFELPGGLRAPWLLLRGRRREDPVLTPVVLLADPAVPGAFTDAASALAAWDGLDATLRVRLAPVAAPAVERLLEAGFVVRKWVLEGAVETAHTRLAGRPTLEDRGFRVAPMESADLDAATDLRARFFASDPASGFGIPGVTCLREQLERFHATLPIDLAVWDGDRFVGHVQCGVEGGIGLVLDADLRGRGLGWSVYATLVPRMLALGISRMRGLTNAPAVLHMGLAMGREVVETWIGRPGVPT